MLGWITKTVKAASDKAAQDAARRQAEAVALANLKDQIDKRFGGFVFMVPPEAYAIKWDDADRKVLAEDDWEMWNDILNTFPSQPLTQKEALDNERKFWSRWAFTSSMESKDGHRELKSHSQIIIIFKYYERWIFREFYAATGKVIDPSHKEIVRIRLKQEHISKPRGEFKYEAQARSRDEVKQLDNELDYYIRVGREAHYEKWGNWFLTHVEERFNQYYESHQQKPHSPKLGDGGFATLDEIESGKSSQSHSTSRAQSQTFKD